MKPEKISYLCFKLISKIDQNKFVSIADIKSFIDDETIFLKLDELINLEKSFFTKDQQTKFIDTWQRYDNACSPEDVGITNNGLCLLLSYVTQTLDEIIKY